MDLIELPTDMLLEINKHLSYIDNLSLSYTCKIFNTYLPKKDINQIIRLNLEEYLGDKVDKFLELLHETNHYISGSFVLKCLYSENWNNDIDIYTFSDDLETNESYASFATWGKFIDGLFNLLPGFQNTECANRYEFLGIISREFSYGRFIIDHIIVINDSYEIKACQKCLFNYKQKREYKSIFNFVEKTFDIDICKVLYDGKKLYLKKKNDLIERSTRAYDKLLEYNRIQFWLEGAPSELDLLDKMLSRIEKYEQRGFIIEKTYNVDQILAEIKNAFKKRLTCCATKYKDFIFSRIPKRFLDFII